MISFTVEGKVKAKQSFKFTKDGRKYTPRDVKEYAEHIRERFREKYPDFKPYEGALRVKISAYYGIPKSFSDKKAHLARMDKLRPTVRPDCDNICKNLCDSLNGIAFKDDKQIVTLIVQKFYADIELVAIQIEELE